MVGVPLSGEGTKGSGRSRLKHGVTSLPDHSHHQHHGPGFGLCPGILGTELGSPL